MEQREPGTQAVLSEPQRPDKMGVKHLDFVEFYWQ